MADLKYDEKIDLEGVEMEKNPFQVFVWQRHTFLYLNVLVILKICLLKINNLIIGVKKSFVIDFKI